jgi:parvulin-like peptidyl-prolyl isomerase
MKLHETETTTTRPIGFKEGGKQSQAPTQRALKRLRTKFIVLAICAFVVGFGLAIFIMKQRAQDRIAVAAVNGAVISSDTFFRTLQMMAGPQTIHQLVENQVQLQYAAKRGLVPTDAQVTARFDELRHQPNFDIIIKNSGMNPDMYVANLKLQMAQEAVFSQGITVTDDEVRQYYLSQCNPKNPRASFYRPAVSTLQTIATRSYAGTEAALTQIDNGVPFDVVARQVSLDSSKANGGRLSPIMQGLSPLSRIPSAEQAVFNLRPGQVTDPITFGNAWWIFKCNEYTPPATIPFDEVAAQARRQAIATKGLIVNGTQIRKGFAAFEHSSKMQAFWPQYAAAIGAHN